ncbi:MAG: NAD-dependent protein deacylase [Oscillospiraceae bacterium]|nr:NAD-dependent protein deacylase [Oscillospiraceae bacterium]
MTEQIARLQQWVEESRSIVAFTGAGFSTESGLKDFRSVDGLYHERYDWPPEEILSHTFFEKRPVEFYRFYRDKMLCPEARPNPAHLKLAQLERAGKLTSVVTQNIDGLHQAAGSRKVWELHGSVHRNYCVACRKSYTAEDILSFEGLPLCSCGCRIKPDVVLYEEPLRGDIMEGAIRDISRADMLIVGGTSLAVYPAAGLINYYTGHRLVLINKSPTPYDYRADLLIEGAVGRVLDQICV